MSRIDDLLAEVRRGLVRVLPERLDEHRSLGAVVVDIRPDSYREREGEIPGALVIERNVLEWRLDPTSPHRLTDGVDATTEVIVVCNDGYASTLAAESLRRIGLEHATDLEGGYRAWRQLSDGQRASH